MSAAASSGASELAGELSPVPGEPHASSAAVGGGVWNHADGAAAAVEAFGEKMTG